MADAVWLRKATAQTRTAINDMSCAVTYISGTNELDRLNALRPPAERLLIVFCSAPTLPSLPTAEAKCGGSPTRREDLPAPDDI